MGWRHIHVRFEPAQPGQEIATAWLAEAGCSMFQDDRDGLDAFAEDSELDLQLLEDIHRDLGPLGLVEWRESEVEEENWNARWEQDYPEVHVGRDIRVRAPFHPEASAASHVHTLTIQPRMAFGTGHHGTTHGILAEMVGLGWEGLSVLDMGCGSGVLGIYAALRGAGDVVLVDIDAWSVRNTRENLTLNGLVEGEKCEVREGGAEALAPSDLDRFDVVIANINRNILMEDMASYCRVLRTPGTLILSGFMAPDVEALTRRAEEFGLSTQHLRSESEWRVLTLRRSG